MAKQGLLAQLKPSANTDTVLYSAPIDRTASTVLTIANDGTGSAYDVALKNYDQKFTLDAATYKLHEGDLITSSVVEVGTPIPSSAPLLVGNTITTTDQEKSFINYYPSIPLLFFNFTVSALTCSSPVLFLISEFPLKCARVKSSPDPNLTS